jgi:acyl-CoA reductase-like NAD-dependent aldehyde dehydrogenase
MMENAKIQTIVERVMREIGQPTAQPIAPTVQVTPPPDLAQYGPPPALAAKGQDGIFPTLDDAIEASQAAFRQLNALPLAIRKDMVAHMRQAGRQYATQLAELAVEETGMGRVEDKILKNILNADKAPGPEVLETGAWSGDGGLTVTEYAPYGIIGSLTPSTNPTSTVICNAISMVAAGNAAVFNAHPGSKRSSNRTVQILNQAIQKAGGMHHKGIRLLVVTGGIAVVRAAMKSGKRAVCAGPGNPPVVVDESADIEQAGRDIVIGGSFDNNIVCTTEKETFAVDAICDSLIDVMTRHGAVKINRWQLDRLWKVLTVKDRGPGKHADMNKDFIGKNANILLKEIGISAGPEVRQIVVEVDRDHPLVWSEQMMPIMPVVRVANADEGIDLAIAAEHGFRHTAVMHSKNLDNLSRMARKIDCSVFVKNGPCLAGLGYGGEGYCSFTIASPTGEGITGPISFSRIRRCTLVDSFRIV